VLAACSPSIQRNAASRAAGSARTSLALKGNCWSLYAITLNSSYGLSCDRGGAEALRNEVKAKLELGGVTSQQQNACNNSIDKGISRSYAPQNKDCVKPIKGVKGF
jgi:hypothetical protein